MGLFVFGCKKTEPDLLALMAGSYEGDYIVNCKNTKGQTFNQVAKRTITITRIALTDSFSVTGIASVPLTGIANGLILTLKKNET